MWCWWPTETRSAGARCRSGFAQGFLTNVLNPKAALFFLSILPQFVHGGGSATRQISSLGIPDVLIGIVYWFVLVAVAARLRSLLARPTFRRRWELTTGWLFIGVAAAACPSERLTSSPPARRSRLLRYR
ncbi:LysE family translocator [Streptomyces griseoluteus]|uniref:LysE family translocator n=1 Tax=Streptomyces griseoluteus TaxID=29306 RepID=UPI0036FAAB1C